MQKQKGGESFCVSGDEKQKKKVGLLCVRGKWRENIGLGYRII